jgi:hypothetical protein
MLRLNANIYIDFSKNRLESPQISLKHFGLAFNVFFFNCLEATNYNFKAT